MDTTWQLCIASPSSHVCVCSIRHTLTQTQTRDFHFACQLCTTLPLFPFRFHFPRTAMWMEGGGEINFSFFFFLPPLSLFYPLLPAMSSLRTVMYYGLHCHPSSSSSSSAAAVQRVWVLLLSLLPVRVSRHRRTKIRQDRQTESLVTICLKMEHFLGGEKFGAWGQNMRRIEIFYASFFPYEHIWDQA